MEFSNPEQILGQVTNLGSGSVVVDLGSGSGHYSLVSARMVKPDGRVYAVDIQKDLLERLEQTATGEGLHDLEIVWGDVDQYGGTKLREGTADFVLMCNILFQLENRSAGIDEAVRILRPGGRLLLVDWTGSHFGMGPDEHLVVNQSMARELLSSKTHLEEEKEIDAGSHHWGLLMRKEQ